MAVDALVMGLGRFGGGMAAAEKIGNTASIAPARTNTRNQVKNKTSMRSFPCYITIEGIFSKIPFV